MLRSYRPCPIKRARRTGADMTALRNTIIAVIEDDPPMTVRQVFYQLVSRGVIEKSEAQYKDTVIRLMSEMRFSGRLPWENVIDESRRVRVTRTYDDVIDAVEHTAKFYRRSALAQCNDYLEIWCEKDALSGSLWDVTFDYDVPLMVSHGMSSITFLHGTALEIQKAAQHGKRSFIYQFGDHDPSGVAIQRSMERRLKQMCEQLDCAPPVVKRAALTEAQIKKYKLPTRPTKRDGNSHANSFVGRSVELDALPPRVLRNMVRKVIEKHISNHELVALRAAEDSERKLLEMWRP
jgi:hypothetical protein